MRMSKPKGGGFCDKHGPFDPPHTQCPYCEIERQERSAYGPPTDALSVRATVPPRPAPDDEARHEAVLPRQSQDATEVIPADEVDPDRMTLDGEIDRVDGGQADDVPDAVEAEPGAESAAQPGPAEPVEPSDPIAWLIVKEPRELRGMILPVMPDQVIGRDGDIRWDDPRLSRQHARLTFEPQEDAPDDPPVFHLWPFAPTNPVIINGRAVRGATPLHENDEIRLGDTLLVFKVLTD
jgi:hypothetical protein